MSARYESPVNSQSQPQFGGNGIIADIVNILTGNRIASNTYDDCGNVTYDSASGTTLEWNTLGLIKKVSGTSGTLVNYSYLADGTKISALDEQGNRLEYRGSLTFRRNGSTGQVVETNDYYPFGKRWDSSSSVTSPDNRFRFNGKEDQSEFGTPYSDYGARQYSSFNGRWLTVDPLAEKY